MLPASAISVNLYFESGQPSDIFSYSGAYACFNRSEMLILLKRMYQKSFVRSQYSAAKRECHVYTRLPINLYDQRHKLVECRS